MIKSYCVKEKKQTESLNPVFVKTKNGRMAMKSKCACCGITKFQFVKSTKGSTKGIGLDIQKALAPLGEMHLRTFPKLQKYEYCGPGTNLNTRIKRGDKGINRLDRVCKQHDIDYDNSKNLKDKQIADQKMVDTINNFNNKTLIERGVKNIISTKKKLGLGHSLQTARINMRHRRLMTFSLLKIRRYIGNA